MQKSFCLKILFYMLLASFIFVVSHLKIHPAVYLNTLKAYVIVVKKKSLLKVSLSLFCFNSQSNYMYKSSRQEF